MSPTHGAFVWYELMTSDVAAAKSFYADVNGWDLQEMPMPGMTYTIANAGGTAVAGLMALPDQVRDAGGRPGWIGYVAVDDVDAGAAAFARDGGMVHRAPDDIPGVGRFAVVADPQGAVLCLFKGSDPEPAAPKPLMARPPGHAGWHELLAFDHAALFDFYAGQFGWTRDTAVDMGGMGVYQLFAHGGAAIGGMMNKPAEVPAPFWLYYFITDGIDEAAERVKAGGGTVINGPHEVPGGMWILQCLDPQGAIFALVGPRKRA